MMDKLKDRLEPELFPAGALDTAYVIASAAISLKRIADVLDTPNPTPDDTARAAAIIVSRFGITTNGELAGLQVINLLAQAGFKVIRK